MSNSKFKISAYQLFFMILTIAVMVIIFMFSSQNAEESSGTSFGLTEAVVKIIDNDYAKRSPERQQEIWSQASFIVRKLAHFTVYTALGFCASMTVGKRKLFSVKSLFVIVFGFLYAFSDEVHQTFSEGRSCEFRDMMIDTSGVTLGTLLSITFIFIITKLYKKT